MVTHSVNQSSNSSRNEIAGLVKPNELLFTEEGKFEEKYTYVNPLGSGGEADCDRYEVIGSYRGVAVKTIHKPNPYADPLHEARVLAALPEHPSISSMNEAFKDCPKKGQYRIVMPLYTGGDLAVLKTRFERYSTKVPEAFLWHVLVQLSEGLHHIHQNSVFPLVHNDLKAENVLLDPTPNGILFDNLKIIDFGMATEGTTPREVKVGTFAYQPPEAPIASPAGDVYALGNICHFLIHSMTVKQKAPPGLNNMKKSEWYANAKAKTHRIVDSNHSAFNLTKDLDYATASKATFNHETPFPAKGYSPLLEYWMRRMLDRDPETRVTTDELVTKMKQDAEKQIELYKAWVLASQLHPVCGFAYPEPPAEWRPESVPEGESLHA